MATNIYGKCTGASSSKYDLWASVSQSNLSIENNESRISVKIYLKRNDGNSSSAYNLYENENTVSLKINGTEKVNKHLTIDTRSGVSALLASYTEDVSHNDDGSLKLNIECIFSMGNSNLSGGSLSGEYKGTAIPRASDISFSDTTVNPGSTMGFTVTSYSQAFSHRLSYSLGKKSRSISLSSGVLSSSFSVPKEWTTEVTSSSSATLCISLTTLNNGAVVGTRSYDIRFIIPATDEYKPDFVISLSRNNGNVPEDYDYYIKGISSVTVEPSELSFSYGASLSAVTVTLGDVSVRRIPAVFNLNSSGDILVTVAVRDTRGMLTVKTQTIRVLDYEKPSLEITSLVRCNESGISEQLGTYGLVSYRIGYSSLNGRNSPAITMRYRKSDNSSFTQLGSVSSSPFVFGDGGLAVGSAYVVVLSVSDSITAEPAETEAYLSGGAVPFNIRKGGNGASFGKFSEKDKLLDVDWDMRVSGDVEILGALRHEDVDCQCTDLSTGMISGSLYYPCLNLVFLRLRIDALQELSANKNHHVATLSDKIPGVFTPVSAVTDFGSGCHSSAGISYGTGNVILWSDKVIPKGSRIYISGYYITDYINTAD